MESIKTANERDESANGTLSVSEFCAKYHIDDGEEKRLRKLLGNYASKHELVMNVQRKPVTR